MIIIEGADLVGKTTLANGLCARLKGYSTKHLGLLPKDWDYYYDYVDRMQRNVIYDRFHMSELVYGQVCRGCSKIGPETYRFVDGRLRGVGCMTIIIISSTSLIKKRYEVKNRREEFDLDQIIKVNHAYARLEDDKCVDINHTIFVDTLNYNVMHDIDDFLKRYNHRQDCLNKLLKKGDLHDGT